ncbi:MAG: dephospho-CoA kinase [Candidatus Sungbacteria bacterium]|nr:dephospho-CoA kinase [Candidatus Sungbacteria bacterium]
MTSGQKLLIIVCGLPGTGKSTVAKILAQRLGAKLLRTDVIRKEIFRQPRYDAKNVDRVYRELFLQAQKSEETRNIILDATFSKKKHRKTALRIAKLLGRRFVIIETMCSVAVVHLRLNKRTHRSISDARFSQYLAMRQSFEKIREPHYVINTSKGQRAVFKKTAALVRQLI